MANLGDNEQPQESAPTTTTIETQAKSMALQDANRADIQAHDQQSESISATQEHGVKKNVLSLDGPSIKTKTAKVIHQIRLLVRRREAGAIIGKKGSNIKRLRDSFSKSAFSIPDTGNGPERVVCITSEPKTMAQILTDIAELLLEKSPRKDDQMELKMLIHSWYAGLLIGMGGQSIKRLRNESKAAIKIFEMCCPFSNERVCAIKAKPQIVVQTLCYIQKLTQDNPQKGALKSYDALNFDLSLVDKYGGFLPEDFPPSLIAPHAINNTFLPYPNQHLAPQSHSNFVESMKQQQQNSHSIPKLNLLFNTLYQHQIACQQQQHREQQQQIRPLKRYSVWRAPINTSTDTKAPDKVQFKSIQEVVSAQTNEEGACKRSNGLNSNRYHPYQQQQQSTLNKLKLQQQQQLSGMSIGNQPDNHMYQLQPMQPTSNQNQLLGFCHNQPASNHLCHLQQNNTDQQQPRLPCLCGLYMSLGANTTLCPVTTTTTITKTQAKDNTMTTIANNNSYANYVIQTGLNSDIINYQQQHVNSNHLPIPKPTDNHDNKIS